MRRERRTALTLGLTMVVGAGALGACTDGNKANEASGDAREAGGAPANDSSPAGYARPGTSGALTDTLRPGPGSGTDTANARARAGGGDTTKRP